MNKTRLSLSLCFSLSLYASSFFTSSKRKVKHTLRCYTVSWDSRVYFYSAKYLENIFSFYDNGGWMREIRIMNVVFLFIFFLFFSCEDEFVRKNRIIRNFYLNLEFLRIFWRLNDVFVQSLIR